MTEEQTEKKFFDWRLIYSISLLIFAGTFVWFVLTLIHDNNEKEQQINRLFSKIEEQDQAANESRRNSAAERDELLRKQQELIDIGSDILAYINRDRSQDQKASQ